MEVTEAYQSTSTDFGEISTEEWVETTEFLISSVEPVREGSVDFEYLQFSSADYVVFGLMLAMSGELRWIFKFNSILKFNFSSNWNLLRFCFEK